MNKKSTRAMKNNISFIFSLTTVIKIKSTAAL